MCGIGGILRVHPPGSGAPPPEVAIPESWLDVIDEAVKHRGPDGRGRFRDRATRADGAIIDVAFVHRRLSIIDHAGGHQPMVQGGTALLSGDEGTYRPVHCHVCPKCQELATQRTPTVREGVLRTADHAGRASGPAHPGADIDPRSGIDRVSNSSLLAVVFNGCIYNHRELRKELQGAGHVFATDHSDTEVLLHGWREWRWGLIHHLEGMFAIAIWDRALQTVAVLRDGFGEKPLYLAWDGPGESDDHLCVFASSSVPPQRILAMESQGHAVHRRVIPSALAQWLALGFSTLATPRWQFCSSLTPGTTECLPSLKELNHSDPAEIPWRVTEARPIGSQEALDDSLDRAVRSRMEADVPLGCFLSGGTDSSLVSLYAKRTLGSLSTFCVRMNDPRYDESKHAAEVAKVIGSNHTTLDARENPAEDLVHLITQLGLPLGDSSLLPTYWVSRAARQHVSVALTGDGGDELFMGYERYQADRVLRRLRWAIALLPTALFGNTDPKGPWNKLRRLVSAARHRGYEDLLAIFPTPELKQLLGTRASWPSQGRAGSRSGRMYDALNYLPGDLMRKVDTASMAVALETRAPLLDRHLAASAFATPESVLMPRGQRKGLLRAVARRYFPPEIVDRPKMGFAIPIGEWFRSDYGGMRTLLLDHLNSVEPWGSPSLGIDLNMKFVRRMLDEHLGTGPSGLVRRDHSQRLYMLLVLSIWAKWLSGL